MKKTRVLIALFVGLATALLPIAAATAASGAVPALPVFGRTVSTNGQSGSFVLFYDDQAGSGDALEAVLGVSSVGSSALSDIDMQAYRDKGLQVENKTSAVRTVDATGVSGLVVKSSLCGVQLKPIEGERFVIEYVGISDRKSLPVSAAVKDGVLTITALGDKGAARYVNLTPGHLAGVVRIGVPTGFLKTLVIEDEISLYRMGEVADAITGKTDMGVILVDGAVLKSSYKLETGSGSLILRGEGIEGKVDLKAKNGDCTVLAADSIASAKLEAKNGDVSLEAKTIGDIELIVKNGDARAVVDAIAVRLAMQSDNGDISVSLPAKPKNLKLSVAHDNGEVSLPSGWKHGLTWGDGKPSLEMKAGNGDIEVSVR